MNRETSPHDDPYNTSPIESYWRLKYFVPALLTSGVALASLLALSIAWTSFGWVMIAVVPFVAGVILGYKSGYRHMFVWMLAAIVSAGVIGGLYALHLAGLLCGLIAAVVIGIPLAAGASVGLLIRVRRDGRWLHENRRQASAGMLLATAGLLWAEAQMPLPAAVEEVRTTRTLAGDAIAAWDSLVFYEEVGAAAPRLTSIVLPFPVGAEGIVNAVGDTKRCLYRGGYLVKRITDYRPGARFAFDVTEQVGVEDRSVVLIDGSFEFEEVEPGRTLVTLTTRYRPLLQARSAWRPFEFAVVHALHDHVLDWMAQRVQPSRESTVPILHSSKTLPIPNVIERGSCSRSSVKRNRPAE